MKKRAESYEKSLTPEIESYRKEYVKASKRDFIPIDLIDLLDHLDSSRLIFLGDFHTFSQGSRNVERLLRKLLRSKEKIILGVEFIHEQYDQIIEQYLNHHITEIEFLESINYKESWRFPWVHYKKFFDLAKTKNIEIVPLNSKGTLKERDERAAQIICGQLEGNPDKKVLVLFGEYHITSNKLPKEVLKIRPKTPLTIIHQNMDSVYWKLERKNIDDDFSIVQFSKDEFALQTSPPWIKYESMIYWYENMISDPEFDLHEYSFENGLMAFNANTNENFVSLCHELSKILDIKVTFGDLEDFNLYDHQSISFVMKKIESLCSPTLINYFRKLIETGKVFRLPGTNTYYTSNYSYNRLTFLAGVHLLAITKKGIDSDSLIKAKNQSEKFFLLLQQYLAGYFCSKIINPYRKCDLYRDIKSQTKDPKNSQTVIKLYQRMIDVIDYHKGKGNIEDILRKQTLAGLNEIARKVGYFLGDFIYEEHFRDSDEPFTLMYNLIFHTNFDEKLFSRLCQHAFLNKDYKKSAKRFF
jgi:hypothetical protein